MMKESWFAVYTKPRCEKKVAALFSKRKIENYCPLNRIVRQWSDRKKLVYEPLFSSYVFIRAMEKDLYVIKQESIDVINLVYWLGKPAIIKDAEIDAIKNFLNEYANVQLERTTVRVADAVRIISGPLKDFEGNITEVQNNKVKLSLPSLGCMMIAEVSVSNVEILQNRFRSNKMVS
jgi:transcription antitermination factor NusG